MTNLLVCIKNSSLAYCEFGTAALSQRLNDCFMKRDLLFYCTKVTSLV